MSRQGLEKVLWYNFTHGWKYFLGTGAAFYMYTHVLDNLVHKEVYGLDGNGGNMIKIVTNLDDSEIARLKAHRRMMWHQIQIHTDKTSMQNTISDTELIDRGIEVVQPKYVEYIKRPPHDKYL